MKTFKKDPDAVLDYTVNWDRYLGTDTIFSSSWVVESGIDSMNETNDDNTATIVLSGGIVGNEYTVTSRISPTSDPTLSDDRSFIVRVIQR